jgi:hypothetical protein
MQRRARRKEGYGVQTVRGRTMMNPETEYLLRRASDEARQAIKSEQPEAADVHEALSVRYSAMAVTLLAKDDPKGN